MLLAVMGENAGVDLRSALPDLGRIRTDEFLVVKVELGIEVKDVEVFMESVTFNTAMGAPIRR